MGNIFFEKLNDFVRCYLSTTLRHEVHDQGVKRNSFPVLVLGASLYEATHSPAVDRLHQTPAVGDVS